ncbi:MAG: hypothetical protein WC465_00750 [Patescibacteria group bacterium]
MKRNKIWILVLLALFLAGCQKSNSIQTGERQNDGERYINMNQYQFYMDSIDKAKNAREQLENISTDVNQE